MFHVEGNLLTNCLNWKDLIRLCAFVRVIPVASQTRPSCCCSVQSSTHSSTSKTFWRGINIREFMDVLMVILVWFYDGETEPDRQIIDL